MLYRMLGDTGMSVSRIGFGASPLGDVFETTDPAENTKAVRCAVDNGINFFDVSPYYGITLAEERLGKALAGIRDRVILSTKCGRYGADSFDFSASRVKRSIDESLSRLRTDYVDLFLAHDIEFGDFDRVVEETIPALRDIQRSGKARYIGITGYPLRMLSAVAQRTEIDVILSYCRYNLLVTDLDTFLAPFAKSNGIGLINASPLHMGLLSGSAVPNWHPAPPAVRRAADAIVNICRARGHSPAVVALRFCIEHPYIASTLVGMCTCEQVKTNLMALSFEIDATLRMEIEAATTPAKNVLWASGRVENTDGAASYENMEQFG